MLLLVASVWGPTGLKSHSQNRLSLHCRGGDSLRSSVMDNGAQRPPGNNNNQGQGARNHNPVLHVRDRLFHALFYRIAITYARAFPRPVRRVLEFAILVKVRCDQKKVRVLGVLLLLLLFYFALKVKEVEFRSSKQSQVEWTLTCTTVFLECEYDLQYSTKS